MRRAAAFAIAAFVLLVAGRARAYYDMEVLSSGPGASPGYIPLGDTDFGGAPTHLSAVSNCNTSNLVACAQVVNLPIHFWYYGKAYNQITVSSSGYIVLGNQAAAGTHFWPTRFTWNGDAHLWTGVDHDVPIIAPFWQIWNPSLTASTGGGVYAGRVNPSGLSDTEYFVIEWRNLRRLSENNPSYAYSFQLRLYTGLRGNGGSIEPPAGTFEFHYGNLALGSYYDNGRRASIGYQMSARTVGHPISYESTEWTTYGNAFRFRYPSACAAYVQAKTLPIWGSQPYSYLHFYRNADQYSPAAWSAEPTTADRDGLTRIEGGPCYSAAVSFAGADWPYYRPFMDPATPPTVTWGAPPSEGGWPVIRYQSFQRMPSWSYQYLYNSRTGHTAPLTYFWPDVPWNGKAPLLVVPGFDPRNVETPDLYLFLMRDIAKRMLDQGYIIAIGDLSDGAADLTKQSYDVNLWVRRVYEDSYPDPRPQVIGVSAGGVLLREALSRSERMKQAGLSTPNGPDYMWPVLDWVKAWYSVDAPHKGANLGTERASLQATVHCRGGLAPDLAALRDMLDTPAARQLLFASTDATQCTCSTHDPGPYIEWDRCTMRSIEHSAYYESEDLAQWPPTTKPRYAIAIGNSARTFANDTTTKMGTIALIDFHYPSIYHDDASWAGAPRDCLAGSTLISEQMVDRSIRDVTGETLLELRLRWEPTFIPIDSALGAVTQKGGVPWSPPLESNDWHCSDPAMTYGSSFDITYWTDVWRHFAPGPYVYDQSDPKKRKPAPRHTEFPAPTAVGNPGIDQHDDFSKRYASCNSRAGYPDACCTSTSTVGCCQRNDGTNGKTFNPPEYYRNGCGVTGTVVGQTVTLTELARVVSGWINAN